ncbi:MAG: aminoacyl-tRNA hydrolase [Paracoccaceae bacterium]
MALDRIAEDHGFAPWRAKFQGRIAEDCWEGKVLLLKPETFMNRSGQRVQAMNFYKLSPADITVFHDELDPAPGKCRAQQGETAGHNGRRPNGHPGPEYGRVRLGIGHPGRKEAVAGYVLHDFPKADDAWLDDLMRGISDGAPALAMGEGARFMNSVGLRMQPARPERKPPAASAGDTAPAGSETQSDTGADAAAAPDTRSPLQRLVDRFR